MNRRLATAMTAAGLLGLAVLAGCSSSSSTGGGTSSSAADGAIILAALILARFVEGTGR